MNELSIPFTLNRADGTTLTFPRVSAFDRFVTFRASFRTWRKIQKLETLALAGVSGEAVIPHLDGFDARRLRDGEVSRWIDDKAGQYEALLLCLKTQDAKATYADVSALGLDEDEMHEAAAGVMGIKLVYPPLPVADETSGSCQTETSDGSAPPFEDTSTSKTLSGSPSTSSTAA